MILLDTDILIEIFDKSSNKGDEALKKIEEEGEGDVMIIALNLHELLHGLHKYASPEKINKVLILDTLGFEKGDAALSARLEAESEKKGKKLSRMDSMIAAVAINKSLKLFTYNKKHYQDIEGLELL